MSHAFIGLLAISLLLLLIFLRVPIAIALVLIGFVGNVSFQGLDPTLVQFQLLIWEVANSFLLIALPLFIWMGQLASAGQLGQDLYRGFQTWTGQVRGGLAVSSILSSASFGAITGSSMATVMAMGQMMMPEMKRYHYAPSLAAGSVASAGVLAIMIPPSIPLVFYSAWTETSLGDLFMAAIFPGLLLTLLFAAYVLIRCKLNPTLAPKGTPSTLKEKIHAIRYLLPILSILIGILGCMYSGVATPTEAAALGVCGVLIAALIKGKLSLKAFKESLSQSALLSANIFTLLLGGMFFSRFLAQTEITQILIDQIATLQVSRYWIITALVLMYLLLGAILDTFGMIILTLPFAFPLILAQGFDPVWFGIFIVLMIELSLITPPVGIHVFLLKRINPEISLTEIFYGTLPFVALTLFMVALLIAFPSLALWLPAQMK
ncbi:MAG: TRAP transporter large permease subunit [Hahellaceae bacterium]|nr:TRAP transporter large permease subunit [Hahellaceae bacterium]MCP5169618.1 TRAP transporter large permease subunit [Hahellaceae bacterium]